MLSIRGCPHCGESPEIKVIIRDYGFNGVVIECPNCKAQIRNAKCSEMIVRLFAPERIYCKDCKNRALAILMSQKEEA